MAVWRGEWPGHGAVALGWSARDGSAQVRADAQRLWARSDAPSGAPVYYTEAADAVRVANSLQPFADRPPCPRGLARWMLGLGLPDATPLRAVRRLAPGQELRGEAVGAGRALRGVASPPPSLQESIAADDVDAAARALHEALHEALWRLAPAGQPVAVSLSGGLDSSAVLAVLLEQRAAHEIVPIAWDLGDRAGDGPYLQAWAQRLGRPLEWLTASDCARWLPKSLVLGGAPSRALTAALDVATAERAQRLGCERVLTGVGGDEVFCGDFPVGLGAGGWRARAQRLATMELPWASPGLGFALREWALPHVRPLLPRASREARFVRRVRPQLPHGAGPALWSALREAAAWHVQAAAPLSPRPSARWRAISARPVWADVAVHRQQIEHETGCVRVDVPLDFALMRAVAELPPGLLLDGARDRGLLRRVLEGRAPQVVVARHQKADFDGFLQRVLQLADASRWLSPWAQVPRLRALGLLQRPLSLAPAWADAAAVTALSYQWNYLAAEAWLCGRERSGEACA